MSLWDWISKKMDEDMPRDSFALQVKKQQQEQDEWWERARKEQDEWLKKRKQEAEEEQDEWLKKRKQEAEEEHRQWERQVTPRITELKQAFEASGRKYNSAEPNEVDSLLTLTEKKIIQQCRRPQCHGCKLGWICPKFWSE